MSALHFDPFAAVVALGVLAVLGFWLWHGGREIRNFAGAVRRLADGRADRQRAGIDAAAHAPESLLRRMAQILVLTALVAILSYALFRKFSLI